MPIAAETRAGRRDRTALTAYDDDEQEFGTRFRRELIDAGIKTSVIHLYDPQIRQRLRQRAEQD